VTTHAEGELEAVERRHQLSRLSDGHVERDELADPPAELLDRFGVGR